MSNTSQTLENVTLVRTDAGAFVKLVDAHGNVIVGEGAAFPVAALASSSPSTTTSEVGTKAGSTVSVVEQGSATVHKSIFTLTATPITLTDDAGVGQWAALKLYDFPAGNIITMGATIDAELTLNEAWWVDASTGNVGLGSVAATSAAALATTKQNIVANTAIAAMTAQVGAIDAQSNATGFTAAAGGTDADATLNIRIDDSAAHMPDVVTNGTFTGAATGWTLGSGWAYGTNKVAATLADTDLSQAVTLVAGVAYSVTYTTTCSAGSVQPTLGGTAGTSRSTAATFTETIIPTTTSGLSFTGTGFSGSIDSVSVTPLTGSGTITGTVTVVWANAGAM